MAKYGVIAVANETKKGKWLDRQLNKEVEHTGLDIVVGTISEKYKGFLPMNDRVVTGSDGRQFTVNNGKITIWDDKLSDALPSVGDIVECEWTQKGTLRYVGLAE